MNYDIGDNNISECAEEITDLNIIYKILREEP